MLSEDKGLLTVMSFTRCTNVCVLDQGQAFVKRHSENRDVTHH